MTALLVSPVMLVPAAAQTTGVATESEPGLSVIRFTLAEGVVTAYLPDDVAPGEDFSGTLEGPSGYALWLGEQRARAGERFHWHTPAGVAHRRLILVLRDRTGIPRMRAAFKLAAPRSKESAFRFPPLIETGRVFPIRGPFDGNVLTTRVTVNGRTGVPLAESMRKVIVRAPLGALGPARSTLTAGKTRVSGDVRSVSIEMAAAASDPNLRSVKIAGLAGLRQDVPLEIGGSWFYVNASEIPANGTFSVERSFRSPANLTARLVIPQSQQDEVAVVLRTPQRTTGVSLMRQHGEALRGLDFDSFPASLELLDDIELGNSAAEALIAADEPRAMRLIFESMPKSGVPIQMLGFTWFLEHQESSRPAAAAALAAAHRVLSRVLSTATAELALYVVGVAGSDADFPLLQRFYGNRGSVDEPLHAASEASLVRLGSQTHLEALRSTLGQPVERGVSYDKAGRVARLLRTAALSGRQELIPVVCGHLSDPIARDVEYVVDPSRNAVATLSALVDGTSPAVANASRRTRDEWTDYCRGVVR